jgi:glycerol-3-phosphate acyltransferase PlsY
MTAIDFSMALWVIVVPVLVGYLLGSISGSLVLGKLSQVDIRSMGSGNAGGTNAFRTQGWRFALGVLIIDIGKGALSTWGVAAAMTTSGAMPEGHAITAASIAGFGAILGHVWPLYFGFRGGKGAGTAVGAVVILAPGCILPMLLVWLSSLLLSGYVGLSTIFAGFVLVPAMWWFGPDPLPTSLAVFAVSVAVLIVFTHRSNIQRLRDGTENRFNTQKLWRR